MDNEALPEPDAFTAPFVAALEEDRAISQPNVMQASEIERSMAAAIDRVLAGEATAEEALGELDTEVEDILFEFY
jgi:multiple sugar transport system substrate-binding protein